MDDRMQQQEDTPADREELDLGAKTMAGKTDLRSTKKELFNKLIANQSHQIIVTTPNKKDGAESPILVNTSLSGNQNYQTGTTSEQEPRHQYQASSGKQPSQQQQQQQQNFLPEDFKREPVVFARSRSRWYTNEEVASILTNFSSHPEWQTNELQVRPKSGAVLLYSREKVRYRQDGYCWKKRKNGRTTREDHMKLKVQGIECIYGCYVHSAILPTFHRRCYWLLQNPDIVLVHYLNQPPDDQNKMMITFNSSLLEADTRRSWTNEEIIEEIGSVFGGISQIQHTLNINFPSSATIIEQQQHQQAENQQLQSIDHDRMIDSSPQSQLSTSNSEAMNEQMDMSTLDQQQHQINSSDGSLGLYHKTHDIRENSRGDEDDDDKIMTTLSQDNNNNDIQISANELNNLSCSAQISNGHEHHQQQQLDDGTMGVTFDVIHECTNNGKNNLDASRQQQQHQLADDCFDDYTNNVSVNDLDNINGNVDILTQTNGASSREEQTSERMEQNPCSPVTQIYNKIVDDIETYALPLEPNQFNSNHHHGLTMSSMPVQPMDIVGEVAGQHIHHQHHHHHHQQQQQQQQQQHNQQRQQQQPAQMNQQFSNAHSRGCDTETGGKTQSSCSMDLTSCDLFESGPNQANPNDQGDRHGGDEDDNLLLTEFNLPSGVGQVSDELGGGVVDSLNNVDDLRDLIMGISPNGNTDHGNLLVDSNSLDLFNFKNSDCVQNRSQSQQHYHQSSGQQLDVKSTTSDTVNASRLSPMVAQVPRCNSTGNPVQTAGQHPSNQQHLSASNYLSCTQDNLIQPNNFLEFHNNQASQRSLSANPSSSASCSPSPSSSSSLRAGVLASGSRSNCIETANQYGNLTSSSIKLPLQQRQKSEQQEPSNSVLSSLLPKALSLDGCDLATSNHRLAMSSLIAYEQDTNEMQESSDQNTLLVTQIQIDQQQTPQALSQLDSEACQQSGAQPHLGSSLTSNIPMDSPSEILVNNSIDNFLGSPAYNSLQHQQQQTHHQHQPSITSSSKLGLDEHNLTTANGLLPILDYVPNWSNINGGAKVLIVGDWGSLLKLGCADNMEQQQQQRFHSDHKDSCDFFAIFDDLLVPATLIQDNVLRCYAPSHEQGFITLKVLHMDRIVSEQVLFEMRPSCNQSANQVGQIYHGNNQNDGQDPYNSDNNNNYSITGNSNTQHRNSTSSNQSASASFSAQKPQVSPSSDSISGDNSKVLTLAENIISAMHKKNSNSSRPPDQPKHLGNSFDSEYLDQHHYPHYNQQPQRQYSLKGAQRRLTGSRSLSRDSELNSNYGLNYGIMDGDPYWHQSPSRDFETMQPLSIVTELLTSSGCNQTSGLISGQKRHSSGSSGFLASRQQQQFATYVQRPNFATMYQNANNQASSYSHQQQHYHHQQQQQPMDSHNLTDASSSGLGSIVSSLSPSTSSLHSPSSACTAATREGVRENQSPCSCSRQSSHTPTSADFCEYFQASARTQESFASLTLNDTEQRELYEAAKVIQKAYRTYRGRKRQASELLVEPASGRLVEDQLVAGYQSSGGLLVVRSADVLETQVSEDPLAGANGQQRFGAYKAPSRTCSLKKQQLLHTPQQQQQQQQPTLLKCYRDREMQAATIIQAYYRRYRQYVHYNRQQSNNKQQQQANIPNPAAVIGGVNLVGATTAYNDSRSPNARLVVDTMAIVIDKATTSHVDRKRFKTASLISGCCVGVAAPGAGTTKNESYDCPQVGQSLLE